MHYSIVVGAPLVLACSLMLFCAQAAPSNTVDVNQQNDPLKAGIEMIKQVSKQIRMNIKQREEGGTPLDEGDKLAIKLSSIKRLREEIDNKMNLKGKNPGMPEGMADVDPTGSAFQDFATTLPILLASPEFARSLSDKSIQNSSLQDYIQIADSTDPIKREKEIKLIRSKTMKRMQDELRKELKSISVALMAKWIENSRKNVSPNDPIGMVLFQFQSGLVELLINGFIELLSTHSGVLIEKFQEMASRMSSKRDTTVVANQTETSELS